MNIDELRTVQTKERQKDSLQHLRDSFYEDVADYIRDLKAERNRAADAADEPFSDPEVSRLTDQIETAEEVVEAVYERRVGKVVKLSSFAAADMPVDEEGLTAQERDLFEDLVARIGQNKGRVLDILAGQGDSGKAPSAGGPDDGSGPDSTPPDAESGPTTEAGTEEFAGTEEAPGRKTTSPDPSDDSPARSEPAFGTGDDSPAGADRSDADDTGDTGASTEDPRAPPDVPPDEEAADEVLADEPRESGSLEPGPTDSDPAVASSTPAVESAMAEADDRTTVRITADVGRVLGVDDREYDLKSEDVVDLPSDNANALLQRNAAEKLE